MISSNMKLDFSIIVIGSASSIISLSGKNRHRLSFSAAMFTRQGKKRTKGEKGNGDKKMKATVHLSFFGLLVSTNEWIDEQVTDYTHTFINWCHHCQLRKWWRTTKWRNRRTRILKPISFWPFIVRFSWLTSLVIIFIWLFPSLLTNGLISPPTIFCQQICRSLLNKKKKENCKSGNMCQYVSRVDIITSN